MSTHGTIRATFAFATSQFGRERNLGNGAVKNGIGFAWACLHNTFVVDFQNRDAAQEGPSNLVVIRHGGWRTRTTKAWIESALTGLLGAGVGQSKSASSDTVTVSWPGKYKAAQSYDGFAPRTPEEVRTYHGDDEITIIRFHSWNGDDWQTESITLKPGESGVLHGHDGTPHTVHYKGE